MARPVKRLAKCVRSGKPAVERTTLSGGARRPSNELLLSLTARATVLSVAGGLEARANDAPALLQRGLLEAVHVADRPGLLAAVADAREGGGPVETRLRLAMNGPGAAVAFERVVLTVYPAAGSGGMAALARIAPEPSPFPSPARSESDRFLANVSHELRTPLNAILGFSELLADCELAPRQSAKRHEYARIIHESASHLLSLVNLVLDASKIEAGKFELDPEPFALRPLIESCCDMLRLKAEAGGVRLVNGPFEAMGPLVADKRAVKQIVVNLLSNAVKFTPRGGQARIWATVDANEVSLVVEDTGVGIASDLLARIGEPFFQAHAAYDRHFEGAGLGLSLVRGLVALHGGAIGIQSAPGKGTRVTVRLPGVGARLAVGAERAELKRQSGRAADQEELKIA